MFSPLTPSTVMRLEKSLVTLSAMERLLVRIERMRFWMAILAIASMLDAPIVVLLGPTVSRIADVFIAVTTLLALPLICGVYVNKAKLFAAQHSLGQLLLDHDIREHWSWLLLRSPHRRAMWAELLVWILFAPPYVRDIWPQVGVLDVVCFFRSYSFVMWWGSRHCTSRVACCALARVSNISITMRYVFASTFVEKPFRTFMLSLWTFWTVASLAFSKLEGRDIGDSFYFVWVTTGTIGYGDVCPHTYGGKFITFLCGLCSWFLISFGMSAMFEKYAKKNTESNMTLIIAAVSAMLYRKEVAAMLVVYAFKHHRALRQAAQKPSKGCCTPFSVQRTANQLYQQCLKQRAARDKVSEFRRRYMEMVSPFEKLKFLDVFSARTRLTLGSSTMSTPAETPEVTPVYPVGSEQLTMERISRKYDHLKYLLQRLQDE